MDIKEKDRFLLKSSTTYIRVMSVNEGYIMARWCGCYPFVKSITEFEETVKDLLYVPYADKSKCIKNKQQNKEQ